jgi:hypothetical protein
MAAPTNKKDLDMKNLKKAALMLMSRYFGYIVWAPEWKGMHFSLTMADAIDWSVQYPVGEAVIVHRGKVV